MNGIRQSACLRAAVLSVVVLGIGCTPSRDDEARRTVTPGAQTATLEEAARPVALPDIARLPVSVQEQVRRRHDALEQAIARRAPREEVGQANGDLGLILMAAEYLEAAEIALRNALSLAPHDPRWPYYLAQLFVDKGDQANAMPLFERASTLRPTDVPTLAWLGHVYLNRGRPEDASRAYARALELQPQSAAARAGLGRARLALGDTAPAAEHLERAIALEPQATSLHYPLAMAYRRLGDLQKAERHARQRGNGEPTLVDPLMEAYASTLDSSLTFQNRGLRSMQTGDFAAAAAFFRRGLALEPDNAALGHLLGTALHQVGQVESAVAQFEDVLRRSPRYARAHFSLGVIFVSQERYVEALARFTEAVKAEPDYLEARLSLAAGLQAMGRPDDALSHYEHVIKTDPRQFEAWVEGANVLLRLRRYQAADAWLTEASHIHPDRPEILELRKNLPAPSRRTHGPR
ncbi:MAG: tetratricopeptide repeat protein [Acidimicrobiia bacterium]|nr:tetratricopeptide repeat protein [Acidimicrobiia bacterium]